jgi:hypothetical protein
LEAIQAEKQKVFRAAVQGLHETITSEVEQLMVEVRLSLSHLNEKVECYQDMAKLYLDQMANCMTGLNERVEGVQEDMARFFQE